MPKREREEVCRTCGHYHDYEGGEPCSICGHVLQTIQAPQHAHAMPIEILPGFLYLGDYNLASRLALLKAMGITHILSVSPSCQELFKQNLEYWTSPCSPADFHQCCQVLDELKTKQVRVMVHCMTGFSRGPAVIIAYLMKSNRMPLAECLALLQSRWRTFKPVQDDLQRLEELQACLANAPPH